MEFSLPNTLIGGGSTIILLLLARICKHLKLHFEANGVNLDVTIDRDNAIDAPNTETP